MATLTNAQIEQKKQQLKQLTEQINAVVNELQEAGEWPLDEDELDQATGGLSSNPSPVGLGRECYVRNGC